KNPEGFVPAEKLALLHDAVLRACDALDAVGDGILEDPRRCGFGRATIRGKQASRAGRLAHGQGESLRHFYSPTLNARTAQEIYRGRERGGGAGWSQGVGNMVARRSRARGDYLQFALFQDPAWDYKSLDFDRDVARADRLDGGVVAAVNADLHDFFQRGGKL